MKKIHISPFGKVKKEGGNNIPLLADVAQGPGDHKERNWKPPLVNIAQRASGNRNAFG